MAKSRSLQRKYFGVPNSTDASLKFVRDLSFFDTRLVGDRMKGMKPHPHLMVVKLKATELN